MLWLIDPSKPKWISMTIAMPETLTSAQQKQLERQCQTRMNWTDAGHWMGNGEAPNCTTRDYIKNSHSRIFKFPTDASATKWNTDWEDNIRHAGHLGTIALTVIGGFFSGSAALTVAAIAAITKDEVQAKIPYPRMARGWSYEFIIEFTFRWSPASPHRSHIIQTLTSISKDFMGKEVNRTSTSKKYSLNQLPDGLARMLASAPSRKTITVY